MLLPVQMFKFYFLILMKQLFLFFVLLFQFFFLDICELMVGTIEVIYVYNCVSRMILYLLLCGAELRVLCCFNRRCVSLKV